MITASKMDKFTVKHNILDVDLSWSYKKMTLGNKSVGRDEFGWSLELCPATHPSFGDVCILGEVAPDGADTVVLEVITTWLAERIKSPEDWQAVVSPK